jgi:hypothetical protein
VDRGLRFPEELKSVARQLRRRGEDAGSEDRSTDELLLWLGPSIGVRKDDGGVLCETIPDQITAG